VNLRFIAATNRNLEEMARNGSFVMKLLILRSDRRAKKATLPGRRYKIGTKFIPNRTIASSASKKIADITRMPQLEFAAIFFRQDRTLVEGNLIGL